MQLVVYIILVLLFIFNHFRCVELETQVNNFHLYFYREAEARVREHQNLARAFRDRDSKLRRRLHTLRLKVYGKSGREKTPLEKNETEAQGE